MFWHAMHACIDNPATIEAQDKLRTNQELDAGRSPDRIKARVWNKLSKRLVNNQ